MDLSGHMAVTDLAECVALLLTDEFNFLRSKLSLQMHPAYFHGFRVGHNDCRSGVNPTQ